MLITTNAESTVFVSQHIAIGIISLQDTVSVCVCGQTQIHLATQYGRHFADEHLMQFKSESWRLLLMQQGGCGTQRRTVTTLDGSQECESLNQMCFGLERKASIFLCKERGAHSKRCAKKQKRKKGQNDPTAGGEGGERRQTSL